MTVITGLTRHSRLKREDHVLVPSALPPVSMMVTLFIGFVLAISMGLLLLRGPESVTTYYCDITACERSALMRDITTISIMMSVYLLTFTVGSFIKVMRTARGRRDLAIAWRTSVKPNLRSAGFVRPKSGKVITISVMFLSVVMMLAASYALFAVGEAQGWEWSGEHRRMPLDTVWKLTCTLLLVAVIAPFMEEWIFRGVLANKLAWGWRWVGLFSIHGLGHKITLANVRFGGFGVSPLGLLAGMVLTSLLFGILHPLGTWVPSIVFGFGMAMTRYVTGSIWPCVIVHALWNIGAVTMMAL